MLHFQVLVDCSGEDGIEKTPETSFLNKKSALLQLLEGSPVSKTIVFCNKVHLSSKVSLVEFQNSWLVHQCFYITFLVSHSIKMYEEN